MKISFQLIISLLFTAALVASVFSYYQVQNERDSLHHELDIRATVLAESLQESIKEYIQSASRVKLQRMVNRFGNRSRLVGIAVYDSIGGNLTISPAVQSIFPSAPPTSVWSPRCMMV